jgi:hypothetical protein
MTHADHLHQLSRESRAQIYGYIYEEISFEWLFEYATWYGTVDVPVINIVATNLLLTSSQIHAEITGFGCAAPLSMDVMWGTLCKIV